MRLILQSGVFRNLQINSRIFIAYLEIRLVKCGELKNFYRSGAPISQQSEYTLPSIQLHNPPRSTQLCKVASSQFKLQKHATTVIMSSKSEAKALPCIFNSLSKEYHDSQLMQCETKEDQRWRHASATAAVLKLTEMG